MRKVFLAAISSISILLSSALSISPASAWVLPDIWSVVSFTVGDSVSRDMGCQENNITDVHFDSGTLPPGLTMDSQGIITGSPTTPGDYTLNGYNCTYSGGSYGGSIPAYSVTFRINAITTPTPTLIAHSLNISTCSFYLGFVFPATPDNGSVYIDIDNGTGNSIHAYLDPTDQRSAGTLYGGNLTIQDLNESTDIFGLLLSVNGYRAYNCGDTLNVSVGYQTSGAPVAEASVSGVVVSKPTVTPSASITAEQSILGACNISIVATVPDEWRPIGIGITSADSTDWITHVTLYESGSANGVINLNLSFTSTDAIFANVPIEDEDKTLNGTPVCSGTFRALIDSPVGILATTTFTLGQTMPTCNAGSILDEEQYRCIAVDRGFYTTELNSSTPIACPAGMTTSTTASKSINDCYKPIVQNIVGLKTPKALKYKATTNLAIITNTKALATYKVTGPCTAKVANIVTKVKGKKVTTKMLKVTAGKKAGSCSITLTSVAKDKYLAMSKPVNIKVSKTGK